MYWLVDRMLPSLVAGIPVFVVGLWIQAHKVARHVENVTSRQNAVIQEKLNAQTEELTGGRAD